MTKNVDVTRESDGIAKDIWALSHRTESLNRGICMENKRRKRKEGEKGKKRKKEKISQGAEYTSRKEEHLKLGIEFNKDSHLVPLCKKNRRSRGRRLLPDMDYRDAR